MGMITRITILAFVALFMTCGASHALDVSVTENSDSIGRYNIYELTMSHSHSYANPWEDVAIAAVSFDESETWPCIRLVSNDGPGREVETMDGRLFTMDKSHAEPGGYMTGCQTEDGLIHIISSIQHYAFNLEWLKTAPPAIQ